MSEILVKVDGEWTDDPAALAASISAMANKDELQTKLIAALEAEIARLREQLESVADRAEAAETALEAARWDLG